MTKRLAGKVAIVTGGARSQGAVGAVLFAEAGAAVIVADVLEDGEAVAADIARAGGTAHFVRLDTASEAGWHSAVEISVARYGRLDILINNAGVNCRDGIMGTSLEDWNRVIAVNLTGCFLGIKAVAAAMRDSGGGAIVNIASVSAHVGQYPASYTASKWGLRGLTKSAALELIDWGIRVNSISPGLIATPMAAAAGEHYRAMSKMIPMKRAGEAAEVAELALFLAGDKAGFITGEDVAIDGGFLAGAAMRRVAEEAGILPIA